MRNHPTARRLARQCLILLLAIPVAVLAQDPAPASASKAPIGAGTAATDMGGTAPSGANADSATTGTGTTSSAGTKGYWLTERPLRAGTGGPLEAMGWYGSFNLDPSFGWITGASNNRTPPGPLANNIRQTDVQAGFTVAVGHEWKAFRMEGEYTWLWRNDFNTYYHGKNPYNLDAFKNNVQSQTALLNTYWHPARAWGGLGAFDPYVGFGLGGTELEFQNVTRYTFKAPTATVINAYTKESMPGHGNGGTSDAFTYMLSTGINYALSEQWFLNLQYRYVNYGTPVRSGPFPSDGGTATAPNYYSHDLLGGIRYRF